MWFLSSYTLLTSIIIIIILITFYHEQKMQQQCILYSIIIHPSQNFINNYFPSLIDVTERNHCFTGPILFHAYISADSVSEFRVHAGEMEEGAKKNTISVVIIGESGTSQSLELEPGI